MFWPCETRTSTCRSFATISSGLYRFLAIAVLLDVKDIPQVGPLQWGWISDEKTTPNQHRCAVLGNRDRARARMAGQHAEADWEITVVSTGRMCNHKLDTRAVRK